MSEVNRAVPCSCGGTDLQHFEDCFTHQAKRYTDQFRYELETRAEESIREIVREEILAALRKADTLPCPPPGDSYSGAVVVPRGSSNPPPMLRDGRCDACGTICYVCPHQFGYPSPVATGGNGAPGNYVDGVGLVGGGGAGYPTDGSNGEGGP